MLTEEQTKYFEIFGFIVMRNYLSPSETNEISGKFDQALDEDRQGQPFDGQQRQCVYSVPESLFPWLIDDDRIYEPLEQMLGPGFVWIGSDSNLYVGDTGWHPDAPPDFRYEGIKVAFYLDPVTKDTGCLRVIPGSHRPPLHDQLRTLIKRDDPDASPLVEPRNIPCFPLESQPGDVVFFNHNTWHAAFGGETGRRMFTLNVKTRPTTERHIQYMRDTYQRNLEYQDGHQSTNKGRLYDDAFLHSDRPRIKSMVGKVLELGFK